MALFELIRDPELAERVPVVVPPDSVDGWDTVASPDQALPVEIQRLRQRALKADAEVAPSSDDSPCPLGALAQEFLKKCLEAAAAAADAPQRDYPDFGDTRFQRIVRVCSVPLIVGDWSTVERGRESAAATAAELFARGYAAPAHRFERNGSGWELSIRFGF